MERLEESLTSKSVRVARIQHGTAVEGPGVRTAIWVQGCTIRCQGCFNPHLWRSSGGAEVLVSDLWKEILKGLEEFPNTEGITWLGGEPFEQAEALGMVSVLAHENDLSVMTFTGYTLSELRGNQEPHFEDAAALLAATDLLVDGRFVDDEVDFVRPWLGSTNQIFHFLSDRYDSQSLLTSDGIELRVMADGTVLVNGWASGSGISAVLDGL
jgi:anaerobic ribonucleoside-triphosphate reductase activating protein